MLSLLFVFGSGGSDPGGVGVHDVDVSAGDGGRVKKGLQVLLLLYVFGLGDGDSNGVGVHSAVLLGTGVAVGYFCKTVFVLAVIVV